MSMITDSSVYFLPLYFSPNPWVMETMDRDVMPLSVKITAHEIGEGILRVSEVDVFSTTGYMPPYPKTKASQYMLLDSVRNAFEEKMDKYIMPIPWSKVIYDGRVKSSQQ